MSNAGSSNLPHPMTPLIGRRRELDAISSLLGNSEVRLLTLVGPGGVGKTRLALCAAEMLARDFADGVRIVDLAPLTDPLLVPHAIAQTLGLAPTPDQGVEAALIEHLANWNLLLLLDNFEHVLESAGLVPRLLVECSELTVLATSREKLGVYGETVFTVDPLPFPEPAPAVSALDVGGADAIALFVERARASWPDFTLTDANAPQVAAVCAQLDGLPLAIELAAARIGVLSPADLRDRINQAMPLLTGGGRDRPPRQQTIRNTIAWSYDELTAEEQALFRRMAIFVGGWSLAAAESVADSQGEVATLDVVASLVDKSLVRRVVAANGQPRFTMLETLRQFGIEQLRIEHNEEEARWAHAGYVLRLVETAEPDLLASRHEKWIPILEEENANVRSAVQWGVSQGDEGSETALRICKAVWFFWKGWGHLEDARIWLQRAIDNGANATPMLLARVLCLQGHSLAHGSIADARLCYERSLDLCRRFNIQVGEAPALYGLGALEYEVGEYDKAKRYFEDGWRISSELGDAYGVAMAKHHLGVVALKSGDYVRANELCEAALADWQRLSQGTNVIFSLVGLARLHRLQRRFGAALACLDQAIDRNKSVGSKEVAGYVDIELAQLALAQGEDQRALDGFLSALWSFRQCGLQDYQTAAAIEGIAAVAMAQGQITEAVRLTAAAERWRDASGIAIASGDRRSIKREMDEARNSLGRDLYNIEWLAGTGTSLDDAVAIAFSVVVRPREIGSGSKRTMPDDLRRLSPREREVLCLIALGYRDREVAEELGIAVRTVTTMVTRVLDKLVSQHQNERHNRTSAAAYAVSSGLCKVASGSAGD